MVVPRLGAVVWRETEGGLRAESWARKEPPAMVCGAQGQRQHVSSRGEAPPCLTHGFRLVLGSHPQPRGPLKGSHRSGLEVSEVVPGSQPGRDTKAMKTYHGEAALKCPLPHFSHLFRAPGWIGGLRYWDSCPAVNLYPYGTSQWMAWGNIRHIWKAFL